MDLGGMKCETMVPERSENDFSEEIEEEFWAVMENIKSEVDMKIDTKPVITPENDESQELKECSRFYEISPPLRCRLCAIPGNDMVNIFDPNGTDECTVEKIERCLPIVVKKTDSLPKQACGSCLASLEFCYQFHKTVAKAEWQLLAFKRSTKKAQNCVSSPLGDGGIKRRLEQGTDAETSSNKRTTVSVKSNVKLADIQPCSTVLSSTKTLKKNNSDNAKSSMDTICSGRSPASVIGQRSTCDSEVSRDTGSGIFSSQSGKRVEHQGKPAIQEQDDDVQPAYACDYCPKKFYSNKELVIHRKIHIDKGLYSCLYCHKEFALPSHRDSHQYVHTSEQPLKRSVCDKTFSLETNIKRNADIHSKNRNYPCSTRNKSFNSLRSDKLRMISRTPTDLWQCTHCHQQFARIGELNSHLKYCKVRNSSPLVNNAM